MLLWLLPRWFIESHRCHGVLLLLKRFWGVRGYNINTHTPIGRGRQRDREQLKGLSASLKMGWEIGDTMKGRVFGDEQIEQCGKDEGLNIGYDLLRGLRTIYLWNLKFIFSTINFEEINKFIWNLSRF